MNTDREWWPEEMLDESMPPGRPTPTDWIVGSVEDLYTIAGWDDNAKTEDMQRVAPGAVVEFFWCDRLGDLQVTFKPDGSFEPLDAVPDHNWCRLEYDQDTLCESLDDLAKAIAQNGLGSSESLPATRVVQFARWSESLPHRLIVDENGARFEPVRVDA